MKDRIVRIDAAAVADGTGLFAAPGSLLLRLPGANGGVESFDTGEGDDPSAGLPELLGAGAAAEVARHPASADAEVYSRPRDLLLPGFVNAHTHLDLTHIGPRPHRSIDHGFVPWIDMIRRERRHEPEGIAASVSLGIALSLAGGTVAVGDIAGAPRGVPSLEPWRTLSRSPLMGVSYLEFFSRGRFREQGLRAGLDVLRAGLTGQTGRASVRLGLQPHAPNTVALSSYIVATREAGALGAPLCTHLAESIEERRFIAAGDGPQQSLLESLGVWDESGGADVGRGEHPVEFLRGALSLAGSSAPYLVAHVNDATDRTIEILAGTCSRVAYCPRASAYFAAPHHFGPHRYRDMLDAGVVVAFGTDSIVNLPAGSEQTGMRGGGMSILEEMRLVLARDGVDPVTVLKMGTINGAIALGLPTDWFSFARAGNAGESPIPPHFLAGVVGVSLEDMPGGGATGRDEWLSKYVRGYTAAKLLLYRNGSDLTELAA